MGNAINMGDLRYPQRSFEHVAALAASGESETLEFNETTGTRREAAMTVCAFLNQGGGQLLFGMALDGALTGQQVGDQTIEDLSEELRRIDPPAFPTIERGEGMGSALVFKYRPGSSVRYEGRWRN